jgi:hypothetical protein
MSTNSPSATRFCGAPPEHQCRPERPDWETVLWFKTKGEKLVCRAGLSKRRTFVEGFELKSSIGVAKSRTRAIWLASSEYLVFADDDIVFNEDGLEAAISYLDQTQSSRCCLRKQATPLETSQAIPKAQNQVGALNSARAATYEMIIRVDAIRQFGVVFDENFGAG